MKVNEILTEAKKKKKKKAALYGPGPFGMYGTNVGYSGDGGAVGEAVTPTTYKVKFGDTLYSIAQKYKLNVDELKKINGLKNNNIQTGQVLKLAAPTPKSKTKPAIATQPVRKGQAAMIAPSNTTSAFAKTDLTQPTVTGSPHETFLRKKAEAAGMRGAELTAFLSQAAHETLNFKFMSEIGGSLDFRKYDPKYAPKKARSLGNVQPGDGARYKGRGYLQITGRYNYKVVGDGIGQPLEKNPKLLEKPEVAAAAAIWYWKNRVKPDVSNFKDVRDVTGEINPGMKHLDRRKEKFDQFNKLAKK